MQIIHGLTGVPVAARLRCKTRTHTHIHQMHRGQERTPSALKKPSMNSRWTHTV